MTVFNGLWQRIVTLPCSTNITDDELDTVAETVLLLIKNDYHCLYDLHAE